MSKERFFSISHPIKNAVEVGQVIFYSPSIFGRINRFETKCSLQFQSFMALCTPASSHFTENPPQQHPTSKVSIHHLSPRRRKKWRREKRGTDLYNIRFITIRLLHVQAHDSCAYVVFVSFCLCIDDTYSQNIFGGIKLHKFNWGQIIASVLCVHVAVTFRIFGVRTLVMWHTG